jgi:ketosteroid isomerase-like protein
MASMIEDDISRLLAERACERLVYRYARFVDSGEAARVADLFTDDGVWIGADGRSMNGQDEIRAAFAGRQGLTRRLSRHVMTNVLIDVLNESEASGTAYLINYRHDGSGGTVEKPAPARHPKFVGDYHFGFRGVENEWRIASLRFDLVFLRPSAVSLPAAGMRSPD